MVTRFLFDNANILGIIGVFLILLAYVLLQVGKMKANWVSYSLLNFVGSGLILISLYIYPNLASQIIEVAWFVISFYGLIKALRRRNKKLPE